MKLKRRCARQAIGALVGVTALAAALTIPSGAAHAVTVTQLQWCDFLSSNVGIDGWSGTTWRGEVDDNECRTIFISTGSNLQVDFFLNNWPTAFKVGSITLSPGQFGEVDFTGSVNSAIDAAVTIHN